MEVTPVTASRPDSKKLRAHKCKPNRSVHEVEQQYYACATFKSSAPPPILTCPDPSAELIC